MSLNMFGTLRYDRDDEHPEFIDRTRSFLGETAAEHRACESCRSRKLKCSGHRSGCDRCIKRGVTCIYSSIETRASHKRARSSLSPFDHNLREPDQPTNADDRGMELGKKRLSVKQKRKSTGDIITNASTGTADNPSRAEPWPASSEKHASPLLPSYKPTDFQVTLCEFGIEAAELFDEGMKTQELLFSSDFLAYTDPSGDDDTVDSSSILTPPLLSVGADAFAVEDLKLGAIGSGTKTRCNCLQTIVGLLEALDEFVLSDKALHNNPGSTSPSADSSRPPSRCHSYLHSHGLMTIYNIDEALAHHKVAVTQCFQVLRCTDCHTARAEHISLLRRVAEKLVHLSDRIVAAYLQTPPPSPGSQDQATIAHNHTMTGSAGGGGRKQPRAFFGRYPTDEDEWECLVRVLINIRLRSLNTLLAGVRQSAGSTVQGRLPAAETRLRTLVGHLQCSVRGLGSAASGHI